MKNLLILSMMLMALSCGDQKPVVEYPDTKKGDVVDVYFGTQVADPYRWLEDDNAAETAEWIAAQNEVTFGYLEHIPFRNALRNRLETIWNYPRYGVPFKKGGKYYHFKNDGLQNQSVLYVQESLEAEPKVLLDPNTFSEDGTIALSNLSLSNDGRYLAYGFSRGGSDWSEIVVMEIENREILPDTVKWVKFSRISWQGNGFYYSAYDPPRPGEALSGANEYHKIYYHKLGTPQSNDHLIFEDKKHPKRNFSAGVTDDERFVIIAASESTSGNALWVRDNLLMGSTFRLIAEGFDYDYSVIDHINGKLLVNTNYEAPMNRVVLIDHLNPAPENWVDLIPEKENVLRSVRLAGDYILVTYLEDANTQAYFYDYEGNMIQKMELPTLGTLTGFNGEKGDNEAFYGFTSFTFPSTVYRYDLEKHTSELFTDSEVDFNPEDFVTEQVFFTSKDGTEVPMFIVHKKGIRLNGDNPVLLYGYGGFNASLVPSFSVARLPFLEQGGVYVSVNLRGGGEYGVKWHQAGTKMNRQNVFDDFIAAAEHLIEINYTRPEKIAMIGGSNGGLLVGAAMTQRPDLFKVAIPIVGVLDMLRYQHFTIGWAWAHDYGTSEESEEMFRYLLGYSPLHNVKQGVHYPATLAITADHDDRVVPAHTFKFIAELQSKHEGPNPILVRVETQAGHGAGKPTSKMIDESADMYSFIMYNLGMRPRF